MASPPSSRSSSRAVRGTPASARRCWTRLIERVKARGLQKLVACALRENHPFVHLARHAGFHVDEADGATQHWVLRLGAADEVAAP